MSTIAGRGTTRGAGAPALGNEERRRVEPERARTLGPTTQRAAELDAVLDAIADGLTVSDAAGRIVRANDAALRILGVGRDALDGSVGDRLQVAGLRHADGRPYAPEETPGMRALRGEVVRGERQRIEHADGRVTWIVTSSAPVREHGVITGAVVTFVDVTESVKAEHEALAADRRKTDFLGVLSHELRNPLASIRAAVRVLDRAAPGSAEKRRAIGVVTRQANQLAHLVDDLLDVTRVARGKVVLARTDVDVGEVVAGAVEDHAALFADHGVALTLERTPAPLPASADRTRLAQIVGNLLQNAAKFTPRGGHARVRVTKVGGDAEIEVRDDGAGIAPETLTHLFEPFVQGAPPRGELRGGLGLGLALARGLADLHGGAVRAASDGPGRGAVFTVTMPLRTDGAHDEPPEPASCRAPAKLRVLIVEDNVDAADTLRDVLELEGHDVTVAYRGTDGLEAARLHRPDVVLCDLGLPGLDGYEVARALRGEPGTAGVLLVALSGYALPEDRQRALEAGFDRHLAKPVDPDDLTRMLAAPPRRGA
jgi:PAS domain S-box-containing protein